jgi:hypothetical protein
MLLRAAVALLLLIAPGCAGAENPAAPTGSELALIQKHLGSLGEAGVWSGERWRVVGSRDGFPVTESIGTWQVEVVPTEKERVVELRGIKIGGPAVVELDLARGILSINGEPFAGRASSGNSPIAQGAPFNGAGFERTRGTVTGSAVILFLEDGTALVDFYKVWSKGKRGEYGKLSRTKPPVEDDSP